MVDFLRTPQKTRLLYNKVKYRWRFCDSCGTCCRNIWQHLIVLESRWSPLRDKWALQLQLRGEPRCTKKYQSNKCMKTTNATKQVTTNSVQKCNKTTKKSSMPSTESKVYYVTIFWCIEESFLLSSFTKRLEKCSGQNIYILNIRAMAVCTFLDSTIFSRWGRSQLQYSAPSVKDNTNFQRRLLFIGIKNTEHWPNLTI
jgi:hypothetical protein